MRTTTPTIRKEEDAPEWIVRPTTRADEANVNRLFSISWTQLLVDEFYDSDLCTRTLQSLERVRARSLLDCGTYYVVVHPRTGALVGAGGWTMEHPIDTASDYPHIRHVASHPDFLRQGIGKALWKQCWKDIVAYTGSERSTVEVLSTLGARAFYESLGFEFEKNMSVPVGEGHELPCYYMLRKV